MNYFTQEELACKHCGKNNFNEEFLKILNGIRAECNFPFIITSAYRCPEHPIEKDKLLPGAHSTGKAVDIAVSGEKALKVLEIALKYDIIRIGINQKGNKRFIHLDVADDEFPSPAIWSY